MGKLRGPSDNLEAEFRHFYAPPDGLVKFYKKPTGYGPGQCSDFRADKIRSRSKQFSVCGFL